ncbi:hypothetical protein [Okeania sp. SIO2B3]|uniref:hypothetical protein n=1 Tax=Okeania sp. SIO2B3 TaxID=2607784 RepID=UPI0013BEBAEF|nr:hypothetical protein [Okeania sp. SIO2B3]NET45435.1 hypothetical protein [Okeania sp. SIO2B3]
MILKDFLQNNNNHALTQIRIGIWGGVGSGKSIYLTRLFECLEKSPNYRIAADDKAIEFIQTNKHILDNEKRPGSLLKETDPAMSELEIFRYTITSQSSWFQDVTIVWEFIDASGEFYENPDSNVQVSDGETTYNIIEYLMSCHGIIFLLDPLRILKTEQTKTYRKLLSDLFIEFRRRSRSSVNQKVTPLEQYMAFCVSKVDEEVAKIDGKIVKKTDVTEEEYQRINSEDDRDWLWKAGQNPYDLVTEIMGEDMTTKLSTEYCRVETKPDKREKPHPQNRCNFYAISAFGRYRDERGELCTVFEDIQPQIPNSNSPDAEEEKNTNVWGNQPDWNSAFCNNSNNQESQTSNSSTGFTWEQEEEYSNVPEPNKLIIKEGVPINSFNIIEPLEWLIKGIRKHPPILFSDRQQTSSVQENQKRVRSRSRKRDN